MNTKFLSAIAILGAVCIGGAVLTSDRVQLNFNHRTDLADTLTKKAKILCNKPIFGIGAKSCDIYLGDTIGSAQSYIEVAQVLDTADKEDTITFHLQGYGGYVDGATFLYSHMKSTDATVITSVEGPVYSAHAFLGVAGDRIKVQDTALFMFHRGSLYNQEKSLCYASAGTKDRRKDAYQKCVDYLHSSSDHVVKLFSRTVKNALTTDQWNAVLDGDDVYLTAEEVRENLRNNA